MFAFHHLGIAVPSIQQALPFYEKVLGYRLVSGPVTDPIQKVSVCFIERTQPGEVIELIEPGNDESSPIHQLLKRGGGAYHTCYQVPDMNAALDLLKENGCRLVSGPVPAVAFENRPIAWVHTLSRHLIELVEGPRPH